MRNRWLVPVGAVAAALVVAACGSSSSGSGGSGSGSGSSPAASAPAASSGTSLKTTKIGSATVLTNAKGHTLYWFVPDTSTKSNCNGSCATYWPPVAGPASAGSGVTGQLGTGTRCTPTSATRRPGWTRATGSTCPAGSGTRSC